MKSKESKNKSSLGVLSNYECEGQYEISDINCNIKEKEYTKKVANKTKKSIELSPNFFV